MSAFKASLARSVRTIAASRAISRCQPSVIAPRALRSFTTIPARQINPTRTVFGSGANDAELSSRLAQEISYEQETAASESGGAEPAFLSDFKSSNIWTIEDIAGSDEIALSRDFGNEHIRVLFSIGDVEAMEDVEEAEEGASGETEEETPNFPVTCTITISKPNQGALALDAQVLDGEFSIENISFYKDGKLATDLTAEADWARRGLYVGPSFETLDDAVQDQFVAYLDERGINTDLALFIPDFAEYKEQKEYCSWLENVKSFVDA
ncbi:mitochondrial Mrb1 [Meredithblackwellia eburnea MCA 4105]